MTAEYNFNRTNGTQLGTVYALEGNGPGAMSVPRQLLDIDFTTTPATLIVDNDITPRFPASAISSLAAVTVDTDGVGVTGNFTNSPQLKPGNKIKLANIPNSGGNGIIDVYDQNLTVQSTSYNSLANETTIFTVEALPTDLVLTYGDFVVSTIHELNLIGGAYDAKYVVATSGASIDAAGNTRIPLHTSTPLVTSVFPIVGASPGSHGTFVIKGATNGECIYRVGSTVNVVNNTLPAANQTYTVMNVSSSGSYIMVDSDATSITIAGDHTKFFVNNSTVIVSSGTAHHLSLTVASVSVVAGNTKINIVEPVTGISTTGTLVLSPVMTTVVVTGVIPNGVGIDGSLVASPSNAWALTIPPAITPTTPHNYLVTWRLTGNLAAQFASGCPIVVKGNDYFEYHELPVQSATYDSGTNVTSIVTAVVSSGTTTPTIDASGYIVYPAPAQPYGYLRYDVPNPISSIELIGKGSPSYNDTTTWGQALQENDLKLVENFADGLRDRVLSVVPGTHGQIILHIRNMNNKMLRVGNTVTYLDDSGLGVGTTVDYTIQSISSTTNSITITTVEPVDVIAAGDGTLIGYAPYPTAMMLGQMYYEIAGPQLLIATDNTDPQDVVVNGIVVQDMPCYSAIDMGNNLVHMLADPVAAQDAVNLRTSDRLYIAKTGGANLLTNARSGQMFGSLNFGELPAGAPDVLGLNVTDSPVRMYGSADIEFDIDGAGDIHIAGAGNIVVDQGNVTVGTGTDTAVLQNHAGAAPTLTFTTSSTSNAVVNLGSNKIVNMSTPTNPTDGANKAYVDGLANGIVWLQPVLDPNLFADALSAPPFITAAVVSATTGAANIWKITGNYASSFSAGTILTITGNSFLAANKAYVVVSAANAGANTDVTVAASTIPVGVANDGVATDTSVAMHKTYIVKAPGTGAWAGFDGHAVTYSVTSVDPVTQTQTWGWVDILGRSVVVGDRFGVFVEPDAEDPLTVLPAGSLAGSAGKVATVSTTSPLTYTFYTPTEPYAFSVTGTSPVLNTAAVNDKSPHFGHSYTFRGTWGTGSYGTNYKWIEFAGPSMLIAGAGLKYAGSVLNVGAGPGIISNADTVQLDTTYANGIYVRLDGAVAMTGNLQLGGFKITNVGVPTVGADAANKTYTDNQDALRVAKTGDTMSGTLTFTAGTVTGLASPSLNADAATKLYADNGDAQRINRAGDTMTGSLIMSGASVGITLPNAPVANTDATNKTYVDTKVAITGSTMTGALVLAADPVVPLGAAPKQYVDNNFVAKAVSTTLSNNVNITFGGTGEVLGLPATPSVAGSATSKAYVDAQDALKADDLLAVHKAGIETITGAKTFSAATTLNNQVTVAADGTNTNLLITSTNITLTGTPVTSGGAANITATAGSNTAGVGGNIAMAGGNGATNGGNITIIGGQGSAGNGGNITITTGTGTTVNGQLSLVAGLASIALNPTGVISIGGAIPTAKSQALVSNSTNPTTATPTWQLVGTRVASAPANSAAAGVVGNWFADDSFFYVYGATGWRRTAISTF